MITDFTLGKYNSSLHEAISLKNLGLIRALCGKADFDYVHPEHGSAIHHCISIGFHEGLEYLLSNEADPNLQHHLYGNIAHHAIGKEDKEAFKTALKYKVNLEELHPEYGVTVLEHLASKSGESYSEMADSCIAALVLAPQEIWSNALHSAIGMRNLPFIQKLCGKADFDYVHPKHGSATHHCISIGFHEGLKYLLSNRADVDLQYPSYGNIAHHAIGKGDSKSLEIALEYGVDLKALHPKHNVTVLEHLAWKNKEKGATEANLNKLPDGVSNSHQKLTLYLSEEEVCVTEFLKGGGLTPRTPNSSNDFASSMTSPNAPSSSEAFNLDEEQVDPLGSGSNLS